MPEAPTSAGLGEVGGQLRLVNLTPHEVVIDGGAPEPIVLEPAGPVARLEVSSRMVEPLAGIPVSRTAFGAIIDLPEPRAGTVYVVASRVAQVAALAGRRDVLAPDTTPDSAIRDAGGHIVAVRRLQTFADDAARERTP